MVTTLTATATLTTRVVASAAHKTLLFYEAGHGREEHLEVELKLFLVCEVGPLDTLGELLAQLLKVVLVTGSCVQELTQHFFYFAMVDGQGLLVLCDVLVSEGSLIRLL